MLQQKFKEFYLTLFLILSKFSKKIFFKIFEFIRTFISRLELKQKRTHTTQNQVAILYYKIIFFDFLTCTKKYYKYNIYLINFYYKKKFLEFFLPTI